MNLQKRVNNLIETRYDSITIAQRDLGKFYFNFTCRESAFRCVFYEGLKHTIKVEASTD